MLPQEDHDPWITSAPESCRWWWFQPHHLRSLALTSGRSRNAIAFDKHAWPNGIPPLYPAREYSDNPMGRWHEAPTHCVALLATPSFGWRRTTSLEFGSVSLTTSPRTSG